MSPSTCWLSRILGVLARRSLGWAPMDESVSLMVLLPAMVLAAWLVDFAGQTQLAAARSAVVAEAAAGQVLDRLVEVDPARVTDTAAPTADVVGIVERNASMGLIRVCDQTDSRYRIHTRIFGLAGLDWAAGQAPAGIEVTVTCPVPVSSLFNPVVTRRAIALAP